jgi:hypothetical protein
MEQEKLVETCKRLRDSVNAFRRLSAYIVSGIVPSREHFIAADKEAEEAVYEATRILGESQKFYERSREG